MSFSPVADDTEGWSGPVILRAGNKKENCGKAEGIPVLHACLDGGRTVRVCIVPIFMTPLNCNFVGRPGQPGRAPLITRYDPVGEGWCVSWGVATSLSPVFVRSASPRRSFCEVVRKNRRGGIMVLVVVACVQASQTGIITRTLSVTPPRPFLATVDLRPPRRATRTSLYAACINYNVALHGRVARAKEIGFPARTVKRNYASTTSAENVADDYEPRCTNHTRNNR